MLALSFSAIKKGEVRRFLTSIDKGTDASHLQEV